jgi:excisionase family DNA binding protein
MHELGKLETPRQLAERVGLSEGAIKRLIDDGRLPFVEVGKRRRIPPGAWQEYLDNSTVRQCRDATKVPSSSFSPSVAASTSSGPNTDAAASAALARQTAQRLKSSSRDSSSGSRASSAPVIHLKS